MIYTDGSEVSKDVMPGVEAQAITLTDVEEDAAALLVVETDVSPLRVDPQTSEAATSAFTLFLPCHMMSTMVQIYCMQQRSLYGYARQEACHCLGTLTLISDDYTIKLLIFCALGENFWKREDITCNMALVVVLEAERERV